MNHSSKIKTRILKYKASMENPKSRSRNAITFLFDEL